MMMKDIIIKKHNEFDMLVEADTGITEDIYDFFKFVDPNHNPGPWTKWDGVIRLFNKKTHRLPIGLLWYLMQWSINMGYSVSLDPQIKDKGDPVQIDRWFGKQVISNDKGLRIDPHWYQEEIVKDVLLIKRRTAIAATAAGKSLIAYLLAKYHVEHNEGKFLLLVSNVSLAEQMEENFYEYSQLNDFDVENNVHKIYSGKEKTTDKQIVISTWQSLYEIADSGDKAYFKDFTFFVGDECHEAKGKSIQNIGKALVNANYRLGLTGTLHESKCPKLQIESIFGKAKHFVGVKTLQNEGKAAKSKIFVCELAYNDADKRFLYNEQKKTKERKTLGKAEFYKKEVDFLVEHRGRNQLIVNMANKLGGNTLILFNYVENHGIPLHKMFVDSKGGRKYHIIHGGVKIEDRTTIKNEMEDTTGNVLLASYATFAKGINIKRIDNIIFASPSKSKIRVLQSLGRGLRLHVDKEHLKLFDLADNLIWSGRKNVTYKHMHERIRYYNKEQLSYSKVDLHV